MLFYGGLGIYQYLVDFAGVGAFIGGTSAAAGGISAAILFGYIASIISKPKIKK